MKNIIYIFVVLALLIASLLSFRNSKEENPPVNEETKNEQVTEGTVTKTEISTETESTQTTPSTYEVVYGAEGFSPSTIEIKIGDTVVFKNESGKGMWIASDPHPIHNENPEFDAGISTANGNSWSFTFTKDGTFSYHNHLNSSFKGKVVVD